MLTLIILALINVLVMKICYDRFFDFKEFQFKFWAASGFIATSISFFTCVLFIIAYFMI